MSSVYLRTTPRDGKPFVTSHECWDPERFIQARHDEQAKDPKLGGTVESISQDEYRRIKWAEAPGRRT